MPLERNVEAFLGCDAAYEEAEIVLFGAPFDSTTSYRPGARFGPAAIRHESYGLETYSPYQDADLCDYAVIRAWRWAASRPVPRKFWGTASCP